jgi:hypothetical protein
VNSSWRSQQLSYQHLSRRSPKPHIKLQSIRPAIIGVHTITCRDPSARHGLVPAHLFPGETERAINVGHAGQQPPRLAHPRIMETGCQRFCGSSKTFNPNLLIGRFSKLVRTDRSAVTTKSQHAPEDTRRD